MASEIHPTAIIDPSATNAYRLIHGTADGWPGWYVEKLGDYLLSQADGELTTSQHQELVDFAKDYQSQGAYHKILSRHVRQSKVAEASPQLIWGKAAPERFEIVENGLHYEMSFQEGYSVGIFLDQRDNRYRLLNGYLGMTVPQLKHGTPPLEILNCFPYTCGFSVCAAKAGAHVTSLDLSKKYLEWGKRNFVLNELDPGAHDFIYGDTFDWLKRLGKKGRSFDVIVLDPPTFSQSKEWGVFRVEKDFSTLIAAAVKVLKPGGYLLASTNAAEWPPEKFLASCENGIHAEKRKPVKSQYYPQPPDFPVHREEPAYLKTVWIQVG